MCGDIEKPSKPDDDDELTLDLNFPLFNTRRAEHGALKVIAYGIVIVISWQLSELQSERDIEIAQFHAIDAALYFIGSNRALQTASPEPIKLRQ